MAKKHIARHYRFYDGYIACGTKSSRTESTSLARGVTCKNCLKYLECHGALKVTNRRKDATQ